MSKRVSPAERVERLRTRYGSHDKLALALKAKAHELKIAKSPNRQTIIRWEKGGSISETYARLLAEMDGAKPTDFRPEPERSPSPRRQMAAILETIAQLEARVSRLEAIVGPQENGAERQEPGAASR